MVSKCGAPCVSGQPGDTIPIKCGGYVSLVISDILWSDGVVSLVSPEIL